MDIVWVVSLILALVFTRLSLIEATEQVQNLGECLPGYYQEKKCENGKPCCKPCEKGHTYTALNNTSEKCFRCSHCGNSMEVKIPCAPTSDTVCKCKAGNYFENEACKTCFPATNFRNENDLEMCKPCQRVECMETSECKKRCAIAPSGTSMTTKPVMSASPTIPAPQSERVTFSTTLNLNPTSMKLPDHSNSLLIWLSFVGAFVTSLVLFWFLLHFCKNLPREEDVLPCWKTKKLERLPQEPNEQHSHHRSSPTTLTFTISEKSPMMPPCQEPSAHNSGHAHQGVHMGTRRYEHSDRWPAILLYEIIKEVPLRRWKEFLRLLSVPDQQMERVELETGLGSMEKQYQMLRLWSQHPSASLNDVYSSLHHMDLSGCAQQLQENIERLQWRCETRQGITV